MSIASSCFHPSERGGDYGQIVSPGQEINLEYRTSFLIAALKGPAEQLGLQPHVPSDADAASAIRPASALVQSMGPGLALTAARASLAKLGSDPCASYLPKTRDALVKLAADLDRADAERKEADARAQAQAESDRAEQARLSAAKRDSIACKVAELKLEICEQQKVINLAQWQIDNERAVGARTGYVRPAIIRNSGAAILYLEQERDALLAKLNTTYGIHFSPTSCGKPPQTVHDVQNYSIPAERYAERDGACSVPRKKASQTPEASR